ncbi:MAG TPA: hypothetical protein VMT93_10950 [Gemmatimonadaceae bacterium]|nr:hypothetical protein [Gemmatimonadaceae bacterium]
MGTDRALQDSLIRLLADAPFRDALMHVDEGVAYGGLAADQVEAIRAGDLRRVDRFGKFLARQYYHERLWHFHKYSRALAHWTGRSPDGLLLTPAFANLLPTIILGSRTTARDLARLVQAYMADARHAPPYAADLVRYENAQLVAESGPRPPASAPPRARPQLATILNPDASIQRFAFDLTAVFKPLLAFEESGQHPDAPPEAPAADLTLVFVRSPRGRVTVLRWTDTIESLTAYLDGERPLSDAIDAASLPPRDGLEIATALLDAGVIIPA